MIKVRSEGLWFQVDNATGWNVNSDGSLTVTNATGEVISVFDTGQWSSIHKWAEA